MKTLESIKSKLALIISVAIFLAVFILATFFDLQISKVLVDLEDGEYLSKNLFGVIFEIIGELPLYLCIAVASIILMLKLLSQKNSKICMLFAIVFAVGGVVGFYFTYQVLFEYLGEHLNFTNLLEGFVDDILYAVAGAITLILVTPLFKKLSTKTLNTLVYFAVVVFITAISSQLLTAGVKSFAGRARYRMMHVLSTTGIEDGFSYYTPWYVFNGKRAVPEIWQSLGVASNGFRSFPSGHTSSAAMTCVLLTLPSLFTALNAKKYKISIYAFAIGFPILVALSRVVVGAHFTTDVLAGGAITFICYGITLIIVNALRKKFKFLQVDKD